MALNFQGGRIVLGTEYAGYKIGIFEPGTTTEKTTYKDSALTGGNENTHPVTLDANGAGQIWFNGNAKWILYTSADVVVYTDDNINLEESSSATGADNLILNGSFEDDTDGDGIPDNWTRTLYTGGAFTTDTTVQSDGATSVKFTSTGTGGGYITSTNNFAIRPSTSYSVGFTLKSSDAGVRNVVTVYWYKADGTASSTASTDLYDDSTTNPTSLTEKWYETTSPSDAYFAKIRLTGCHSSDATAGSTWFDGVILSAAAIKRAINTFSNLVKLKAGADIASAGTVDLTAATGNTVVITGTTTTTALTMNTGQQMVLLPSGAWPLTYHATTMNINGGASYTCAAGDRILAVKDLAGVIRVTVIKQDGTPVVGSTIVLAGVATTSGTSVTLASSIPAWVKHVLIGLKGVSGSGTSMVIIQLGDSGGFETTGYTGAVFADGAVSQLSSGFAIMPAGYTSAAESVSGSMLLTRVESGAETWACQGVFGRDGGTVGCAVGGYKTLSDVLTQISITTAGGTDTFDAGGGYISYW